MVVRASPSPHRARPDPHGCPVGLAPDHAMRLPVLLRSSSCTHAVIITPADSLGAYFARFPRQWQPSPCQRWVGSASAISGPARCSLVTACVLAESPKVTLLHQRASPNRVSFSIAPTASGWSESCQVGFAPTRRPRLSTARSDRLLGLQESRSCHMATVSQVLPHERVWVLMFAMPWLSPPITSHR